MVEDASIRIIDQLTVDQREALDSLGTPVSFPSDHTIFWEGQPSRSVLIILQGYLKVTRQGSDGSDVILAIRGEREVMGEEGVLMNEPRSATVTTITPVNGLDIAAEDLLRFVDDQGLWAVMYRAVVRRRRQSDQRAVFARLGVKSRLARWLLELAEEIGEPVKEGWSIGISMSQQELAGRIGASRDAVAIELRRLREQGLVITGRRSIVLRDLEALRQISLI